MTSLTFTVPLPPVALSPNRARTVYHLAKAEDVLAYRQLVMVEAMNARIANPRWIPPGKARVSLLWCLKRVDKHCYHPEDPDNAVGSFKAGFDGLRDAKVLVDDTWEHFELGAVTADRSRPSGIIITIEEAS
jgi:hypothetical protein